RALDAERMRRMGWRELLGDFRVLDACAHLLAPELILGAIGLLVEQHVVEGRQPWCKASIGPHLFVSGAALLRRDLERTLGQKVDVEAAERFRALLESSGEVLLQLAIRFGVEPHLAHRQRQIWRALKHRELLGLLARFLDDLHAARAGADHGDTLAAEIEALLRPQRSVMAFALEAVHALVLRNVGLRSEARAQHEVATADVFTLARLHHPLVLLAIEIRCSHSRIDLDVAAQIQLLVDVIEIVAPLLPRRIHLAVVPVAPKVLARVLVHRPVGVDARTGITIPIPDAPDVRARLHALHLEAEIAQSVELIQSGEASADDERIERLRWCGTHDSSLNVVMVSTPAPLTTA